MQKNEYQSTFCEPIEVDICLKLYHMHNVWLLYHIDTASCLTFWIACFFRMLWDILAYSDQILKRCFCHLHIAISYAHAKVFAKFVLRRVHAIKILNFAWTEGINCYFLKYKCGFRKYGVPCFFFKLFRLREHGLNLNSFNIGSLLI